MLSSTTISELISDTLQSHRAYRRIVKVRLAGGILHIVEAELQAGIGQNHWWLYGRHRTSDRLKIGEKHLNFFLNPLLHELFELIGYHISVILDQEHNAVSG